MSISVVVPCYNAAAVLPEQLEALCGQTATSGWELVVVDNGSTDETFATVERFRDRLPSLKVVEAAGRKGAGYARNAGVAAASGDLLLFCDADDVVAPGWIEAMAEAVRPDTIVAGRWESRRLNSPCLSAAFPLPQDAGLQEWDPPWLPHAGGGNLAIPRPVLEAVGPFDEDLRALEDTEYCFRAQLAGVRLVFEPSAVVSIRMRATPRGQYRQMRDYAEGQVGLVKRFRSRGMPPPPRLRGLAAWALVPLRLLAVRDRVAFARWLTLLGWRVGRLRGSVRYRLLAL